MSAVVTRWRFTVADNDCMARAGIVRENVRVEFIDAEVVQMAPIGS